MPDVFANGSDTLVIAEESLFEVIAEYPFYGSIDESNRYFALMLHGEQWDRESYIRKYKALVSATQKIDDLRFAGRKTDDSQTLEFPRFGDTTVPLAIRQACYEIALALLKGVQSDTEYDNLFVTLRKFGQLETDYDYRSVPEHKKAGIPSLTAWQKLMPYLKPALDLRLRRES